MKRLLATSLLFAFPYAAQAAPSVDIGDPRALDTLDGVAYSGNVVLTGKPGTLQPAK